MNKKFKDIGLFIKTPLQHLSILHCDYNITMHIEHIDPHDHFFHDDNDPRGLLFIAIIFNQFT
jgi:hypothetical protein